MNNLWNACMATKSSIQIQMEMNQIIENFKHGLTNITEQYTVRGNVFGICNGKLQECTTGYFVIESEKDNLQDAIREMKGLNSYIRIVENKYQVGDVLSRLSLCPANSKVVDIETQAMIQE